MNYCRYDNSGTGTQNAGLAAGGYKGPPGGIQSSTEEYNGTSWAYGGSLPASSRDMAMAGTQNAAVTAGSRFTNTYCSCTFEYNGSSWSTGGALPSARVAGGAGGTQNAAVTFAGYLNTPTPTYKCDSFEYNGSSWSSGPNLINARGWVRGDGTQNAALAVGGSPTSAFPTTELYDGTSWSSYCNLIIGISQNAGTKQGTSTDAMVSHGVNESCNNTQYISSGPTEIFITSSCIFESNLYGGTCSIGCTLVPYVAAVPAACSYSSGPNISVGRSWGGSVGTGTAAAIFGGYQTPGPNCLQCTEEYDGSSWSTGGAQIYRTYANEGAGGTVNAAINAGGYAAPSYRNYVEMYNGSSWATGPGMPYNVGYLDGAGLQDDYASHGGYYNPSRRNYHQYYNGSSWSNCTGLPSSVRHHTSTGNSGESAGAIGGYPGSSWSPGRCDFQIWNGSSWSSGPNQITGAGYTAGGGTIDCTMTGYSGIPSSWPSFTPRPPTQLYNGVSWSAGPDAGVNRYGALGGGNNATTSVGAGGYPGSYPSTTCTQIWCETVATPQQGGSGLSICAYTNESNLNTGRMDGMGAGESKNSAVVSSGYVTPGTNYVTCTEEWDGSSWSAGGANIYAMTATRGAGTANATSQVGGYSPPSYRSYHLQYDGSTWATTTSYPSNIGYMANLGTQTDLLLTGGYSPARRTDVTLYNGTSWASETSLPVANHVHNAAGASSNAAITAGGNQNAYGNCAHYDYDGSTWSAGPNMPVGVGYGVSGGTADCAIAGHSNLSSAWPSFSRCHQSWNGTTWSAGPSYDTNKYGAMGNSRSGTSTIGAGGYPGSYPATNVAQSFEDCFDAPVFRCEMMNSLFTSSAATGSINHIKLAFISGSGT